MVTPLYPEYTPAEIWKAVDGFDGLYTVSTLGRVHSARVLLTATSFVKDGDVYVTLFGADRRPHIRRVAVLVLTAFTGPAPFEGAIVIFKDGNHRNCAADNLSWGAADSGSHDHQRPARPFLWMRDDDTAHSRAAVLLTRRALSRRASRVSVGVHS